MSAKIIAAVAAAGLFCGTVPFYMSGHFSHKALADQLQLATAMQTQSYSIENIQSELGLYDSQFNYDIVFNISDPELEGLRQRVGSDTLSLTINNRAKHGFMNVKIDTSFSGQAKDLVDEIFSDLKLTTEDGNSPLMTIVSDASISFTGQYQMTTVADVQGFSLHSVNESGEDEQLKFTPFISTATIDGTRVEGSTDIAEMLVQTGDSKISFNNLVFSGSGEMALDAKNALETFKNQQFAIQLDKVNLSSPDQSFDAGKNFLWQFTTRVEAERAFLDSRLTLEKAGHPDIPQTQVDNLEVDLTADGGSQALIAYYEAIEQMQGSPDDPQMAMNMFAKLFSQEFNINVNSVKAQTFMGPVDMTAQLNVKAVDEQKFQTDPMALLEAVSYAAKGELPRALVMMSGQLPPELLDNLIQNDMLSVEGEQLKFDMQGEKGQVNLNGKPLI